MMISHTAGRPIPAATPAPRRRATAPLVLGALALLALGGLVALLLVNHLIQVQIEIYGEAHMAATSAMLDFMDDIYPYLMLYIVASTLLALLALMAWLWTRPAPPWARTAMLVALGVVLTLGLVWAARGQRALHSGNGPRPMTPTPEVRAPGLRP